MTWVETYRKGRNIPNSGNATTVLANCNIVDNYRQDWRVLYTYVANKSFGHLLDISLKIFTLLKNLEFLYIKVWFTHQNSK